MSDPLDLISEIQENVANLKGKTKRYVRKASAKALADLMTRIDSYNFENQGGWTQASEFAVQIQLEEYIKAATRNTAVALAVMSSASAKRSVLDASKWLTALDKRYVGSVRRVRFDLAEYLATREGFLINHYEKSLSFWGKTTSDAMRRVVSQDIMVGKNWAEIAEHMKKEIPAVAKAKLWMLRRVANTEVAYTYNRAAVDFLVSQDEPGRRLYKKLVATFDERTGDDSRVLHGQTVLVDQPFINVDGRGYMHPPNRCRDREIVVAWRPEYANILANRDLDTEE